MDNKWPRRKIMSLGKVVTGKTPSTHNPQNFGGPYPFITIPDLERRVYIWDTARTISEQGSALIRSCLLPANAVMMSCIATVGKCGITVKPSFTNQQINSVICNNNVEPRYLYYCFRQLKHELEATGGGGSVYTNVSKTRFSELEIPLPPLPEQRAIAATLGALDDKIELNRQMNQTLEAMAQTLFKSWFVGFEPFRDQGMQDSPLGEIPTGWSFGVIGDLCNVAVGGDWGQDEPCSDSTLTICLRGVDLEQLRANGYSHAPERWLKHTSLQKRRISEEDVLIAASGLGPLGRPLWIHPGIHHLYPHPLTYSNFCKRLIAHSPMHALYVERVLLSMRESGQIWDYSTGTSIPNLDLDGLLSHAIVIPAANVLSQFYHMVSACYSRLYSPESLTLASIRDTLLPELLSGEIRVRDAEKFVEE